MEALAGYKGLVVENTVCYSVASSRFCGKKAGSV